MSKTMDFIRDFLKYVETVGIYDEYDKEAQKMVTSKGVLNLVERAQACLPEKLTNLQAANKMRDLSEEERARLIQESEDGRVIDMRKHFQQKMSQNGGAYGLVERFVAALETSHEDLPKVILDAQALIRGPENVPLYNHKEEE